METVKDPAFINTLLPLVVILFIIGGGVVLLYLHFQKNLVSKKLEQETLKTLHQTELLRSSIQVQEEERKRIAQDMHDELGAVLSIMRMNIVMLEQQNKDAEAHVLKSIQNIRSLSEHALSNMRHISHQLMPPQLESFGLENTLESVIEKINNTGKTEVTLTVSNSLRQMGWPVTLGLYRIIMELINNTLKHAAASEIVIDIKLQNNWVICNYTDNGKGIPVNTTGKGLGHSGINGRAHALNGSFEMGNRNEGGFYGIIQLPVITG